MAQRRTIRSQSWSVSSAGPFAAALAAASNLSVGSGVFVFFFSLAHLTASARFRAGPQGPYPAGYAGRPAGGTGHDVPVSRCVSAAGIRFSVIRCPPRSWALLTVGLPDADRIRTSTGLPLSARTSYGRGGCLLYPEDGGALPGRGTCSAGACRSSAASPSTPLRPSHPRRAMSYEASVGGLGSSPVRPAPHL